jgi:hypothetical protein
MYNSQGWVRKHESPRSTLVVADAFLGPAMDTITTEARGSATITVNSQTGTLFVSLYVDRLSNITMAHIHMTDGVIVPLFQYDQPVNKTGYIFRGHASVSKPNTIQKFLQLLRAGQLYLNIHTTAHPVGEISGFLKTI